MIRLSVFKNLLLYLLFSIVLIFLYIELSHFWVSCGGISSKIKYIEIPVLVILLLVLYFPSKNIFRTALLSVVPILGLYILYDVFYHFLARSPRLSDIRNASALNDFSPLMWIGLIMIVLLIISSIFYQIYIFKKEQKNKHFILF